MIKVALIANSESPGGAEEYLYRLYSSLVFSAEVSVTLIGSLPAWNPELGEQIASGVTKKLTMKASIAPQAAAAASSVPSTLLALRKIDADLVHIQYMKEKLLLPRLIPRDTPILWTEHGPLPDNLPGFGAKILAFQARRATVLGVSEGVKASLSGAGIDSVVVPNPLPEVREASEIHDEAAPCRPYTVGYVGRLHSSKRIDMLLGAARQNPNTKFLVAGNGPAQSELQMNASSNVTFLGHVDDPFEVYRQCHVVALTSGMAAREGSPMAMLEGRRMGLHVVVARDSHAAKEAHMLGCSLFDPGVIGLSETLAQLRGVAAMPLPDDVIAERQIDSWADKHLDLMEQMLEGRAR